MTETRMIHGKKFTIAKDRTEQHGIVVTVEQDCLHCLSPNRVIMPETAFEAWVDGEFIQNAWPDSTPSLREAVISGFHGHCWDEMLGL